MGGKPKSFGAKGSVSIKVQAPGEEATTITSPAPPKVHKLELVRGMGGSEGLYMNCHRVAGSKPWGGGPIVKSWRVTEEDLQDGIDSHRDADEPREWTRRERSTLVYVETRAVDYRGILDFRHINDEDVKHLDDLEEHGLLVNMGTGVNRMYKLTDEGWRVVGLERRRKAELSHGDHERT